MEFRTVTSCWGVFLMLLLTLQAGPSQAASWSYKGSTGPKFWHDLFPQACSGRYQSPVDIRVEQTLYNPDLRDFAIWYDPPKPDSSMTVLNNGHTVQVVTSGQFFVTNGGLPNVYKSVQFHFHWGHAKHHGSEHLIDSRAYPLEMHIVSYNSDLYGSIGEAVTEKQGLAVLGVMFQITEEDNEDMEPVISAMEQVRDPEDRHQVEIEPLSLRRLLPHDISRYFRYNGSLTTPGCFESVIWTVFAQTQHLSHRQMNKFREQLQVRHKVGTGGHHKKRSVEGMEPMPATRRERRRERRALKVLEELALSPEEQARFRRDLTEKKHHAEALAARMDEENAGETHRRTMDAVHTKADHDDDHDDDLHDDDGDEGHLSELEIEFVQEELVNNFRPVQPLNGRLVQRSFKLRDSSYEEDDYPPYYHQKGKHHHHRPHIAKSRANLPDEETIRKRLEMYENDSSSAPGVLVSGMLLALSFILHLFL